MNVRFEYLYRDAGNFKNWGEVIFSNENDHNIEWLEKQIKNVLIDHEFFMVEKVGIPDLKFKEYIKALDHDWHEFYSISRSNDNITDLQNRDIIEFLKSLEDSVKQIVR